MNDDVGYHLGFLLKNLPLRLKVQNHEVLHFRNELGRIFAGVGFHQRRKSKNQCLLRTYAAILGWPRMAE